MDTLNAYLHDDYVRFTFFFGFGSMVIELGAHLETESKEGSNPMDKKRHGFSQI